MALTLQKIAANVAEVTFPFAGESITVVFYPGRITEKTMAQLQAFSSMDETSIADSFASFNDVLASLIKSWDVYVDDEQTVMFPIDPLELAVLPISFRLEVLSQIMGQIRPEMLAPQTRN